MAPGARSKFGAPMFEPEVFRKLMYCFEKSAYDIVGTFWSPAVIRRPAICVPCSPRYVSGVMQLKSENFPKANKFSSPNVMNICNFRTQYCLDLAQTANKGYWRHFRFIRVVLCHVYASPRVFSAWTCVFLLIIKLRTFNKLHF